MSKREQIEERAEKLVTPIAAEFGTEVYDVEYVNEAGEMYLRVYLDKPDGVNIIDCENVSRKFSDVLDAEDFIDDAYYLEVSSPGLGRALKKDKHLEKSIGEEVELKTFKPINKQKEFVGILKAFDPETVTIEIDGKDTTFTRKEVALIKLTLDF